jgi:hypothetical protein
VVIHQHNSPLIVFMGNVKAYLQKDV